MRIKHISIKLIIFSLGVLMHLLGRYNKMDVLWDVGSLCVLISFFIPDRALGKTKEQEDDSNCTEDGSVC